LAINPEGDVWVAQWGKNDVKELSPEGSLLRTITNTEDKHCAKSLDRPRGIALDSKGNLWVVDQNNSRILKLNAGTGECELEIAESPTELEEDNAPDGIAIGATGDVWVSESLGMKLPGASVSSRARLRSYRRRQDRDAPATRLRRCQ
jgi:sugar lactone lactonase YvrE